jgi:hypothetical protein
VAPQQAAPRDHLGVTGLSSGSAAIAFAGGPLSFQDGVPPLDRLKLGSSGPIPRVAADDDALGACPDRGRPLLRVGGDDAEFLGALGVAQLRVGAADLESAWVGPKAVATCSTRTRTPGALGVSGTSTTTASSPDVTATTPQRYTTRGIRLGRPEGLPPGCGYA